MSGLLVLAAVVFVWWLFLTLVGWLVVKSGQDW